LHHDLAARSPIRLPQPSLRTYTINSLRSTWVLVCLLVLSLYALAAHAQTANDGFNPLANREVRSSFVEFFGSIFVGGNFTIVGGASRAGVAKLNVDGSADLGFDPGSGPNNGQVNVVADSRGASVVVGRVLVGGAFTSFNGKSTPLIVRLLASGAVDSTFVPPSTLSGVVWAIATQPDGNILIGGQFTNNAGFTNLVRLDGNGRHDQNFTVNVNGPVFSIAVLPNGKILIGGSFTSVNGQARTNFARLNSDGGLDTSYDASISGVNSQVSSHVSSIVVQPDGKTIVAGSFDKVGSVSRQSIARLNTNGSLDTSFEAVTVNGNGSIATVALQSDGRVLIGGGFGAVNGVTQHRIARLNQNGTLDPLHVNPDGSVRTISVQADGGIILGGSFFTINGVQRNSLARLTPVGFLDDTFDRDASGDALNGQVLAIATRADGEVVVGGEFTNTSPGPAFMQRLAPDGRRINAPSVPLTGPVRALATQTDGNIIRGGSFTRGIDREIPGVGLDPLFNPGGAGANGIIKAIAMLNGGQILIGGSFTTYNGVPRRNIARLNPDGSLDNAFIGPATLADVNALKEQTNGRILVGGFGYMLGLNPQGDVDTTFNVSLNAFGSVNVILASEAAFGIFIGGSFSQVNGVSAGNLALLTSTGSRDISFFTAKTDGPVLSMIQQTEGRIIIGGAFTKVNDIVSQRLAVITDFRGDLLTDYASAVVNGVVTALALQTDGKLLIGGNFTSVQNRSRSHIARFSAVGAVQPSLSVSKNLIGFQSINFDMGRFGHAELSSVVNFELSTDATNWTFLGGDSDNTNGQAFIFGQSLPKGRLFYIRASTRVPSGTNNGSSSPYELVKQFFLPANSTNDLDGNGKSDLIFRNSNTGQISASLMNGTITSASSVLVGSGSRTVSHTADFNGDGKTDILFRNDDGSVTMSLMNGLTVTQIKDLQGPNPDWRVSHVGDFNGDGKADILWRNTNGAITLWLMNGTSIISAVDLLGPTPDWRVSHVADLDGDGKVDIVWRNTQSGEVFVWIMNGATVTKAAQVIALGSNWVVTHTGDLNGDGKSDLIVKDSVNGQIAVYLMNGINVLSNALIQISAGMSVAHVADVDGDGKADLILSFGPGRTYIKIMDGVNTIGGGSLSINNGGLWTAVHVGDFNGDGKADVVFQSDTGALQMVLLDGITKLDSAILQGPGTGWKVVPAQ
jgi:uncharacterized delta-60 repeat protein